MYYGGTQEAYYFVGSFCQVRKYSSQGTYEYVHDSAAKKSRDPPTSFSKEIVICCILHSDD